MSQGIGRQLRERDIQQNKASHYAFTQIIEKQLLSHIFDIQNFPCLIRVYFYFIGHQFEIIMDSEINQYERNQTESECPECNRKYGESGSDCGEGSSSEERIVIPLRRQLLNHGNGSQQIQQTLRNLQIEVNNLKRSNSDKDKIIDDLKREMDHKMTHYMLYGELSKQSEEINRLRSELSHNNHNNHNNHSQAHHNKPSIDLKLNEIRNIVREETKKVATERSFRSSDLRKQPKSQYSKLRNQFIFEKRYASPEDNVTKQKFNDYFEPKKNKNVFNVREAKAKIQELTQKIKFYEEQMLWMSNFVTTFTQTMQNLAYKKYQEQIIIPEWSLKKKAKTSWRYLKHTMKFLYQEISK